MFYDSLVCCHVQGAIDGAVNVDSGRSTTQSKAKGAGWLTLAAVGVGAVIVGALTIR